jgi:acyl dehydratase
VTLTGRQTSPPELHRVVTQERINAYAMVSGDHNPLHIDPAFAAETQFGGPIAHGMLLFGYLSDAMSRAYGEAWAATGRLRVRFRAPARPGDKLVVTGVVRGTEEAPDGRTLVRCSLECKSEAGQVLASGDASVTV